MGGGVGEPPCYLPPRGFCAPGPGGCALWRLGSAQRSSRSRGVGRGRAGCPLPSQRLCVSNPNPAVDRLLVKWSLASSAPNRVEVSMMRKFCDTGIRKRLADTGVGGVLFKGTVGPPLPPFAPARELPGLERRRILNIGVRCHRCLATWRLPPPLRVRGDLARLPSRTSLPRFSTQHLCLSGPKWVLIPGVVPAVCPPGPPPQKDSFGGSIFLLFVDFVLLSCCGHFGKGFPNDHWRVIISAKS